MYMNDIETTIKRGTKGSKLHEDSNLFEDPDKKPNDLFDFKKLKEG